MKKIVSVILTVCLIASVTVTALAATMSATANKTTIKAGDKVTVTLSLSEKIDNVATYGYQLYFDGNLFELNSDESQAGPSSSLTTLSRVQKDTKGSYVNISVIDATSKGVTVNAGNVYTLVFTAKKDITGNQTGKFELVFDNCTDIYDNDIAGVDAGAAVSVTVEGAHVHSWTKAKDAKAATCKEAGNIEYYTCSCGKYAKLENGKYVEIALADTMIPKTNNHTLKHEDAVVSTTCGQDNVAEHWVCTVCGKLFTDKDGKNETTLDKLTTKKAHTLVKVEAVAATCTTDGTKEHYKCTVCNRLFTDKNGNNETTADKLVIPAAHKLVKTDAKAATCTAPGNKEYWTCDVCKKVFSDAAGKNEIALADTTIAALGHKLTKTEKVDSTCTATGHEAYWTCSRCKGIFADEQGTTATTLDKLTIEKKAHTPGDYVTNATEHFKTCSVCGIEIKDSRAKHTFVKDEATGVETCSVCGYAIGGKVDENHQHAAGNDWFRDENNHWHKCTDRKCTAHVDEAKHDFETVSTTKDGNKTTTVEKCKTCGYVKTTTVDNTPVTPVNPSKPGRPSGTKTVQSGKTFDAGVGVYVGLSILSLTGSAVVIGKKRKDR